MAKKKSEETLEDRVATLEARVKSEAIEHGSTLCSLGRLGGTVEEIQRRISGGQPTDKNGKLLEPGDEITWTPIHCDYRKPAQPNMSGYYGGIRPDGSLILFLRDAEGELERCFFPYSFSHLAQQILNRQKDNRHGKEETGREGQ